MKFKILGYEIEIRRAGQDDGQSPGRELARAGTAARQIRTWEKIERAVEEIVARGENPSEYRIRKVAGVSPNTVRKYRDRIESLKKTLQEQK